jgi:hypothetical protein
MPHVQIQIISESVLFLPLSFCTPEEYNLISNLIEMVKKIQAHESIDIGLMLLLSHYCCA